MACFYYFWIFFVLVIYFIDYTVQKQDDLIQKRIKHKHLEIPDHRLSLITRLSDKDHLRRTVKSILIPRVVGTPGHDDVRDFIISSMKTLNWTITRNSFRDNTPMGMKTFENVIATLNPNAERFLVLACHYDSKYFPNDEFLGATDSAVPCAMLINLAFVLKEQLIEAMQNNELSLKFIFFDGEEAFQIWGPQDSIYGARHLADKWEKEDYLKRIDLLFLLDLIGTPDPKFYSFFKNTENLYSHLFFIEERLAVGGYLENYTTNSAIRSLPNRYFQPQTAKSFIEDDHIPFLIRDVPILHLIPVPFPDVWHTTTDNHDIIDYSTVENINKILRIFVMEYLNVQV